MTHFLYVPFTGLGLYNGFRGNHWLRNRIKVFKNYVVPSLEAQTDKDFHLWVSWRPQEKNNEQVIELKKYLDQKFITTFTFGGVCFWDDKYPDDKARERLMMAIHNSVYHFGTIKGEVLMTIQPSDDCYRKTMVEEVKKTFEIYPDAQAVGYLKGYIVDYKSGQVAEYNPNTIPPFFTIKFPGDVFIDPLKHLNYTGPYKSHEYIAQHLKYYGTDVRGFLVGIHGENISTIFDHPFRGVRVNPSVLNDFGLENLNPLNIKLHLGKRIMRKLPYSWQRKLRYIFGERFLSRIYNIGNK